MPGHPDPVLRFDRALVRRGSSVLVGPVDWEVCAGDRWAVVGPNGSGKTTLLQLASARLHPSSGRVEVLGAPTGGRGANVPALRRRVGVASASLAAAIPDNLVPLDAVVPAVDGALVPWWSHPTPGQVDRGRGLLEALGVPTVDARSIATLSTGERQRVAIARALMPDPDLLFLDEPAARLDLGAREELVDRLESLAAAPRPAAIVLVTHHVEEIPDRFDRALVLARGRVVAAGPIEATLTGDVLSEAFGLPLVVERRDGRFAARRAR